MSPAVRPAGPADRPAIAAVLTEAFTAAFGRSEEAALVGRLRAAGLVAVELVAVVEGAIAGHIAFSRLGVAADGRLLKALALAPVSVKPGLQSQGTGGRLIEAGHAAARGMGFDAVFVLGHPAYYPRFGYSAAAARPFRSPFAGDHFMALALAPGALDAASGAVTYPPAWQL
jgi:putative acetyltransferase